MKYSISQLMIAMIALAIYSAAVAAAYRGNSVGFGLAVAIPAATLFFLAYASVYWCAFAVAKFFWKTPFDPQPELTETTGETADGEAHV